VGEKHEDGPQDPRHSPPFRVAVNPNGDHDPENQEKEAEEAGEAKPRPEPGPAPVPKAVAESFNDSQGDQDQRPKKAGGHEDRQDDENDAQGFRRRRVHLFSPISLNEKGLEKFTSGREPQ
jgi:hypothetical protein